MANKYKDEMCLTGYGSKDPKERKKLKHPLAYVRIKQYRIEKEENYKKTRTEESNHPNDWFSIFKKVISGILPRRTEKSPIC